MLERVNSVSWVSSPLFDSNSLSLIQTFEENLTLDGILGELILPSVRRDDVPLFKEKAITCLGLCCLISTVWIYHPPRVFSALTC